MEPRLQDPERQIAHLIQVNPIDYKVLIASAANFAVIEKLK
jgi:hypothetical protein